MNLFNRKISNWDDWGRVYQSTEAFGPLLEHILKKCKLPVADAVNLTPGTNAVFRTGNYVIKIFAPYESGIDQMSDMETEIFATRHVNNIGITAPMLIADGFVDDTYRFGYIITEYIEGVEFQYAVKSMNESEKIMTGRKLREITDGFNLPCTPFNDINIFNDEYINKRFADFPESFKMERMDYIKKQNYSHNVFVHGDLFGDNVIVDDDGKLYIIDFADAVLAPICYEHAIVAIDFFDFDKSLLKGYFGDAGREELAKMCLDGLLIHNFGCGVVKEHIGETDEFKSINDLRKCIYEKMPI